MIVGKDKTFISICSSRPSLDGSMCRKTTPNYNSNNTRRAIRATAVIDMYIPEDGRHCDVRCLLILVSKSHRPPTTDPMQEIIVLPLARI